VWYNNGELGNGSGADVDATAPVLVNSTGNFSDVSIMWGHGCAVMTNGTIACWGNDDNGALGNAASGTQYSPDETNTSGYIKVTVGFQFSCALHENGSIACWGRDLFGQVGNGASGGPTAPETISGSNMFVDLASGADHACGLLVNGSVGDEMIVVLLEMACQCQMLIHRSL
jgi:alpha-tubulin suppressor-like RCC1 family protein